MERLTFVKHKQKKTQKTNQEFGSTAPFSENLPTQKNFLSSSKSIFQTEITIINFLKKLHKV